MSTPPKIGIIAGEESGQLLALDLFNTLTKTMGQKPKLIGVGGEALGEFGLEPIFDPNEIALTGISSVLKSLPRLIMRINQTVDAIVAEEPDCLILIDSPDFSLRVAKKVNAKLPSLTIFKYVAPTVWAWRPNRAAEMRSYIDTVLAILPFEPAIMEELGGPQTQYVGHRLMADRALTSAWKTNASKKGLSNETLNLLVLPGSRTSEIKSLIDVFGEAVAILEQRGHTVSVSIPTLPRHMDEVRRRTASWRHSPTITTQREDQIAAYKSADAALAASGTVTLELALAGVPAVSCYKVDPIMNLATSMITAWSAALPNLIADRPIIREFYNEQVRPGMLARCVEDLVDFNGPSRKAVMNGYKLVQERMKTERPAGTIAAEIIAAKLNITSTN